MAVKKRSKNDHIFKRCWRSIKNFFKRMGAGIADKMGSGASLRGTWKVMRPVSVCIISVVLCVTLLAVAFNTVNNALFAPVDRHNDAPVVVVVKSGTSMSRVATQLKEAGLLNTTWGIKLLADFTNRSNKVKSGEYVLDRTMSVEEILSLITQPMPAQHVVKVTIPEGYSLEQMANLLQSKGVIENAQSFLAAARSGEEFSSYYFMKDLYKRENVQYMLEGYLFPDTYEFYVGSSNSAVINKLMTQFNYVYKPAYSLRATQLGMTMNQVITLASLIEKEGLQKDFAKISAVFHNRLKADMPLQTDAAIQYILHTERLVLTSEELAVDSPYNLHKNKGLAPGPICAPSRKAIEAALYPDQTIISGKYYYFTLTDPATGECAFSKTYEEHQRVVEQWRPVWEAYDKAQGT